MLLFRRRAIRGPAQAGSAAIGSCLCLDRRTVFEDQDWRLEADRHGAGESGHGLDHLISWVRDVGVEMAEDAQAAVSHDVVVTHDGNRLFAYAATRVALDRARAAIERVLEREGITGVITVSHWDHELDDWRQIEPPPTGEAKAKLLTEERDAETVQMRTIVCGAGNLVRETLEQSMLAYARELGVDCKLVEHPHLLTTQVALTVTGPRRKLDEFRQALEAEGWATIRGDWNVLNPL